MTGIEETLARRTKENEDMFFVKAVPVTQAGNYTVIRRRKLFGLTDSTGTEVLIPIYDSIKVFDNDMALVAVGTDGALFRLPSGKRLTEFRYSKAGYENGLLVLFSSDGTRSYFNPDNGCSIGSGYDRVSSYPNALGFRWAMRGRCFDYVSDNGGHKVSLPTVTMAYDCDEGLFGLGGFGTVKCFANDGTEDFLKLRRIVIENGGHLSLQNKDLAIEHIIDVYGNILNPQ